MESLARPRYCAQGCSNRFLPTKYSLATALFAYTTSGIGFALLSWGTRIPILAACGAAILMFWCGAAGLSFGSSRFPGNFLLAFVGAGLIGWSVLIVLISILACFLPGQLY